MNPILCEIPEELATARLLLRTPRAGDGAAMNAAIVESIEEFRPWLTWVKEAPTVEESEIHVRQTYAGFLSRQQISYLLFPQNSPETCVGRVGFVNSDWQVPKFEIGYWMRTSHGGHGYVTEAVAAVTNFAFDTLGAKRVEIRCDSLNERSVAVPRRLGFELEATLRCECRNHITGELRDTLVFAKIAGDA